MRASYLIKGIIRNIPGIKFLRNNKGSTGGTCDGRYCYSIWLRHLVIGFENGITTLPKVVAELGPGDSLGTGIAALIGGADKYIGVDVVEFSSTEANLKIFDELVELFKSRAAIPGDDEYPGVKPKLKTYDFPSHIFSEAHLAEALKPERLKKLRAEIEAMRLNDKGSDVVSYFVPWDGTLIKNGSVDMVISQAAMQHLDALEETYQIFSRWIKKGGFISHQVDFRSLNALETWYKHWEYSELEWKFLKFGKVYITNREPHSTYINLLTKYKFRIISDVKIAAETTIERSKLASRFKNNPPEDFQISGAFIQAVKE